jgi:hypothetical protein
MIVKMKDTCLAKTGINENLEIMVVIQIRTLIIHFCSGQKLEKVNNFMFYEAKLVQEQKIIQV